ncbi:DNA primase family protein [Corynebacterium sputi]|uniref:DNA primase family protein n=1 Tax=Corynebacterium sputi TaxID=489915 RepID=UPI0003FA7DB1|nr:phage/plasmid primase, P4 family [Corynebacterium sputi]
MTEKFYPPPNTPMSVARRVIADTFTATITIDAAADRKIQTIGSWRDGRYRYNGRYWQDAHPKGKDLKSVLYRVLEVANYFDPKDEVPVPFNPTRAKVANVLDCIESLEHDLLPDRLDAPFWINTYDDQDPADQYVVMNNGMLHLPSKTLEPHSPELFSTWALPFDYDNSATCPVWQRFISEIFAHDAHGALSLQEFMGYLISGRMEQHKGFAIIGPGRAGKGTISRIIKQLVGVENTASPSLHTLGSEFGLAELIGMPFAVIEDARRDDTRGSSRAVEVLLNIIGNDAVSINRKNHEYWNGTLPTRMMIVSNEVPRFVDTSAAIASRFIAVQLTQTFRGREDVELGNKLTAELPGIFNWALAGLQRLDEQGRFTIPGTHDQVTEIMADSASPLQVFVNDRYDVTGDENDIIPVSEVHRKYRNHCDDMGTKPLSQIEFFRQIGAIDPNIKAKNTRINGEDKKSRYIFGIREPAGFPSAAHVKSA